MEKQCFLSAKICLYTVLLVITTSSAAATVSPKGGQVAHDMILDDSAPMMDIMPMFGKTMNHFSGRMSYVAYPVTLSSGFDVKHFIAWWLKLDVHSQKMIKQRITRLVASKKDDLDDLDDLKAVPLSATIWLFGSGLIGLVAIGRRRSSS